MVNTDRLQKMSDLVRRVQRYIDRAMSMRDSNVDEEDKERVKTLLWKYFQIHALRPLEPLFFDKITGSLTTLNQSKFTSKEEIFKEYEVFDPDLVFQLDGKTAVVEIDGDVHWKNTKSVKRTNLRNETYYDAGLTMLWLTRENVRGMETEDIVPLISQQLGIIRVD